jgi:hypothetical protein
MKLTTYAWIMALVVFVGTLPHAVGAMFLRSQIYISQKSHLPRCETVVTSLSNMKKIAKTIARGKVMAEYKSSYEWKSLFTLWNKESRWDYTANNKHSTAYGIPQMLNMKEDTPMTEQINLGLKYIKHRYGSPSKALAFHKHHGWY